MPEDSPRAPSFSVWKTLQEAQSSLNGLAQGLLHQIGGKSTANAHPTVEIPDEKKFGTEVNQNGLLHKQWEAWKQNPSWTDHPPRMKVDAPKGTLCHIKSNFQLGMPPDELYNIVIDPENKRVFKNIKEVTYRKVLEDEGHRQLVEVEQSAIWRFLCFSGTLSIRLFVDQNRHTHSLKFHLAKEGFMKKFEGSWDVKPVYVDSPHCELITSLEDDPSCSRSRIASEVQYKLILQPIYIPPPPVSWYIRGISRRQMESLIEDLQAEAKRLREGNERMLESPQQQVKQTETTHVSTQPLEPLEISAHGHLRSSRRRRRNSAWLRK